MRVVRHTRELAAMLKQLNKRFVTTEVRKLLIEEGLVMGRERIGKMGDALGLGQDENERGLARRYYVEDEVRVILAAFALVRELRISDEKAVELVKGGEKAVRDHLSEVIQAAKFAHAQLTTSSAA
jgi:hypothetical protein